MTDNISKIISFVVELEGLMTERDEWANSYMLHSIKRDVLRKYGPGGEELREAIDELDSRATKAKGFFEGATADLTTLTGIEDPEEARKLLIKLKSLLSLYAEKTGKEFVLSSGAEDMSAEEILNFSRELIKNG